ncbi:hypothetical protein M404DRAFT_992157 [Pisolithus tinctorius Marx 270]|uniref:Uncharacterized protein n=1 Tax=Pisolithus tinctorius Marx 270 TaxID=870435 RepID=A0A0C3PIH0_PISTI|nr:hypothetical protein M404DRAFT_992157 [Pisolithus tinctorius Marx 270]
MEALQSSLDTVPSRIKVGANGDIKLSTPEQRLLPQARLCTRKLKQSVYYILAAVGSSGGHVVASRGRKSPYALERVRGKQANYMWHG